MQRSFKRELDDLDLRTYAEEDLGVVMETEERYSYSNSSSNVSFSYEPYESCDFPEDPSFIEMNLEEMINEQVENCKKLLEPMLRDMIRTKVKPPGLSLPSPKKKVIEVIELSDSEEEEEVDEEEEDEEEEEEEEEKGQEKKEEKKKEDEPEEKKCEIFESKTNRRFQKVPTKTNHVGQKLDTDKIWMVRKSSSESAQEENILKIRMEKKKKKKKKRSSADEWVIKKSKENKSHQKEDPAEVFICDTCNFYDCHTLACFKRHLQTHREPKYKCNSCLKMFFTKYDLAIHERTHVKTFSCCLCRKKCCTSQGLFRHMKAHFDKTRFYCRYCEKSYAWKKDLDFHLFIKHKRKY